MKIFRIEEITLKPMIVLAHDVDDAVNVFAHHLVMGLGQRPDADFSVAEWHPKPTGPASRVAKWADQGFRGMAWSVEDGQGWEFHHTKMIEP